MGVGNKTQLVSNFQSMIVFVLHFLRRQLRWLIARGSATKDGTRNTVPQEAHISSTYD